MYIIILVGLCVRNFPMFDPNNKTAIRFCNINHYTFDMHTRCSTKRIYLWQYSESYNFVFVNFRGLLARGTLFGEGFQRMLRVGYAR